MTIRIQIFLLLCAAITAAATASFNRNDILRMKFSPHIRAHALAQQHSGRLAKTSALVWKQTGAIHYYNTASSNGSVQWVFDSRDTMMYDAAGNNVLRKASFAQSGWETDSMGFLDSSVYSGGRLMEEVTMEFPNNGHRSTYNYLNDGKTMVSIEYTFDSTKKMLPSIKDSLIFSAPIANNDQGMAQYAYFLGIYEFLYDTTNSSWEKYFNMTKVNEESAAMKLVLQGGVGDTGDIDYIAEKYIYTSTNSDWSRSDYIELRVQFINPSTEAFEDAHKVVYSSTSEEDFDWDTTAKIWTHVYGIYQDSHGNDTLELNRSYNFGTKKWDTSETRYSRTYDANGSNIVTIVSDYSSSNATWQIEQKDTNIFAQINAPILRLAQASSAQKVSMVVSPGCLRFSAPGITELNLFDASGRLVASIKQQAAPSISLSLSSSQGAMIPSGLYVAELGRKTGKSAFAVPIHRR